MKIIAHFNVGGAVTLDGEYENAEAACQAIQRMLQNNHLVITGHRLDLILPLSAAEYFKLEPSENKSRHSFA